MGGERSQRKRRREGEGEKIYEGMNDQPVLSKEPGQQLVFCVYSKGRVARTCKVQGTSLHIPTGFCPLL